MRSSIVAVVVGLFALAVGAVAKDGPGTRTADGVWTLLAGHDQGVIAGKAWVRPARGQALAANLVALKPILLQAPLERTERAKAAPLVLQLPDPEGKLQSFLVVESPIMQPALAVQFPEIKTYLGQGMDDPSATLRADLTPQGFHAQVLTPQGDWYIDPFTQFDTTHYTSYRKRALRQLHAWACLVPDNAGIFAPRDVPPDEISNGTTLRDFTVAVAATGEYTAFHGGSVALGQAAIVTAINRVTGVYEKELAVRLTLVGTNSSIVYTNSGTDPYTNGDGIAMLTQNQTNCDAVIGSANYDVGHVFSTGGGGVASLGVTCTGGSKARGVTGSPSPTGDAFWIDYVAHEMGHQFGGNHSFNGSGGNCAGGNRNGATAYEPGSGSTIMAYAGICGADDLQPNSDAYFHGISLEEIVTRVSGAGGTCATNTATGNTIPTVNAGLDKAIPIGTPYELTAVGSDGNGDALTYCWEERDLGPQVALAAADQGSIPLVRSRNPATSPTRLIPQLSNILTNTTNAQEKLFALGRTSTYRVYARDNRAGGGGIVSDDVVLTVSAAAGPFSITSQNSLTSWTAGTSQTITWNVASTNAGTVNTPNVDILLSTDGGNTFPITLASATPNDGTQAITVPNNTTTTGRIKVKGTGNYFFDINNANITISGSAPVVFVGTGNNTITDNTGNGNNNGRIDPGETSIGVFVQIRNDGTSTATGVTGTLSSLTGTVTVTTAGASYPNIGPTGGLGTNTTAYVINVSAGHACGAPINLRLNISSAQGTGLYDFSLPTGLTGGTGGPFTFSYTGPAVAIPDNNATGVSATVSVTGLTGTIADVNLRLDSGGACSSAIGSTTAGIDHTWVGDLIVTLQSPTGTIITLMNRPGGVNNDGNNFCNTTLDDEAASPIQSIVNTGNPYSASFTPSSALVGFDGQAPNGTWTLRVSDNAAVDTGSLRRFSVIITTQNPPTCDPPGGGCTAPSITTNPSNMTVCSGGSVTFNVAATGTAPLSYQWRKNGTNISGATSTSLTFNPVVTGDAGSYDCVVTNSCGSATSSAATLTVNVAPSITTQPASLTRCVGTSATFTVAATGSPSPTFQWRKNGTNIGGATGSSLTFASVVLSDAASYDCVVTNTCGSVTSSAATLTVNIAPSITSHPSNQTVCAGAPASFSVTASGTPSPTFQWRKNGTNIGGATAATYNIASTVAGDAGSYDCVVTNSCGSVTSNAATLTVNTGPSITSNPSNQSVPPGGTANYGVVASGTAPLSYQWRKDGSNLSDGGDISGATTPNLSIANADPSDEGAYDVVVTNACGSATSTAADLGVQCPADIDDGSGTGTPDGSVDISDLLYFLALFDLGDLGADFDDGSGTGTQDGAVDISDLLYFLARFDLGC